MLFTRSLCQIQGGCECNHHRKGSGEDSDNMTVIIFIYLTGTKVISLNLIIEKIFFNFMAQKFSCVWLFATPRTTARQAPLSMGFSRQEHWSGLPFPSPGDLPNPETEDI